MAQSPQLYKQMAISSDFEKVFTIGEGELLACQLVLVPCTVGSGVMSCFIPALTSPKGPVEKFENMILYCQESMEKYLKINSERPPIKFSIVYSGRFCTWRMRSQTVVYCVRSTYLSMCLTLKGCGWCSYAKWLRDAAPRLFIDFSLG